MAGQFSWFWSVILPASMFSLSFLMTYLLYRHFVGQMQEGEKPDSE